MLTGSHHSALFRLEIFEPEESAGFAHGLVDRLGRVRRRESPWLPPRQAASASATGPFAPACRRLAEACRSCRRKPLACSGKAANFGLDMLGRVGADDETFVRQLDRRGEQLLPGSLPYSRCQRFPGVGVSRRRDRFRPFTVLHVVRRLERRKTSASVAPRESGRSHPGSASHPCRHRNEAERQTPPRPTIIGSTT